MSGVAFVRAEWGAWNSAYFGISICRRKTDFYFRAKCKVGILVRCVEW